MRHDSVNARKQLELRRRADDLPGCQNFVNFHESIITHHDGGRYGVFSLYRVFSPLTSCEERKNLSGCILLPCADGMEIAPPFASTPVSEFL